MSTDALENQDEFKTPGHLKTKGGLPLLFVGAVLFVLSPANANAQTSNNKNTGNNNLITLAEFTDEASANKLSILEAKDLARQHSVKSGLGFVIFKGQEHASVDNDKLIEHFKNNVFGGDQDVQEEIFIAEYEGQITKYSAYIDGIAHEEWAYMNKDEFGKQKTDIVSYQKLILMERLQTASIEEQDQLNNE